MKKRVNEEIIMNKINFSDKMKVKDNKNDSLDEKGKVKTYCLTKKKSLVGSMGTPGFNYESCSDELTWLENIVNDFEWYRMKKNDLFINQSVDQDNSDKGSKPPLKHSIRAIRIVSETKKKPNKTHGSIIPQSSKHQSVTKINSTDKTITKAKKCQKGGNKENTLPQKNTEKSKKPNKPEGMLFGAKQIESEQMKKPTQNKFLYSKKATTIKAARKGVFQSKENEKKFGLICKNRSIEMKEIGQKVEDQSMEMKETGKKGEEIKAESKKQYIYLDSKDYLTSKTRFNSECFIQKSHKRTNSKTKTQRRLNSSVGSQHHHHLLNASSSLQNLSYDQSLTQSKPLKQCTNEPPPTINKIKYGMNPTYEREVDDGREGQHSDIDILQIFKCLDKGRTGIISPHNCDTDNLTDKIKYILRPILLKINNEQARYDITTFITELTKILNLSPEDQLMSSAKFKIVSSPREPLAIPSRRSSSNSVVMKKYALSKPVYPKQDQIETIFDHRNTSSLRCATFQGEHHDEQFISKEPNRKRALNELGSYKASQNLLQKISCKSSAHLEKPFEFSGRGELEKLQVLNRRIERYIIDKSLEDFSKPINLTAYQ